MSRLVSKQLHMQQSLHWYCKWEIILRHFIFLIHSIVCSSIPVHFSIQWYVTLHIFFFHYSSQHNSAALYHVDSRKDPHLPNLHCGYIINLLHCGYIINLLNLYQLPVNTANNEFRWWSTQMMVSSVADCSGHSQKFKVCATGMSSNCRAWIYFSRSFHYLELLNTPPVSVLLDWWAQNCSQK